MDDEEEINLEDTYDITHELDNQNAVTSPFGDAIFSRGAPGGGGPDLLADGLKSETEDEFIGPGHDSSDVSSEQLHAIGGEPRTLLQRIGLGVVFIQCCKCNF